MVTPYRKAITEAEYSALVAHPIGLGVTVADAGTMIRPEKTIQAHVQRPIPMIGVPVGAPGKLHLGAQPVFTGQLQTVLGKQRLPAGFRGITIERRL